VARSRGPQKAQPGNPTRGLDLPGPDRGRDRFATLAKAEVLLAVLPRTDQPIWATAMYAGLRRGELMALRRADVDVASGVIHVRRSYDLVEDAFIQPKSYAGRRKVPIAAWLRALLLDALIRSDSHQLIFARPDGRPFSPYSLAARANQNWKTPAARRSRCTSAAILSPR
jgi:integrase